MIEKIVDAYYELADYMNGFLAVLLIILAVLVGLGIGFGISMGLAWVVMMVYNAIAFAVGWPTFPIWFWLGVLVVVAWLRGSLFKVKITKK